MSDYPEGYVPPAHFNSKCLDCGSRFIDDAFVELGPAETVTYDRACASCQKDFLATFTAPGKTCLHCDQVFIPLKGRGRARRYCYSCLPELTPDGYDEYNQMSVALFRFAAKGRHGRCCSKVQP